MRFALTRPRQSGRKTPSRRRRAGARTRLSLEPLEKRLLLAQDLLLADVENDRIVRYDGDTGAEVGDFVPAGSGGLVDPLDPTFGPDGNLYVISLDPGSEQILRYDGSSGSFLDVFVNTGDGGYQGASAIEFGPDGDLYVATNRADGVLRFDGESAEFLGALGAGQFTRATGLDFGVDGHAYVLDTDGLVETFADRIVRIDVQSGALTDDVVAPGFLDHVAFFSFGPDGNFYIPELSSSTIRRFNGVTGNLEDVFAATSLVPSSVFDVAFASDGQAYVTGADGIHRFDSETGQFVDNFIDGTTGWLTFFPEVATDLEVTEVQVPEAAITGIEFAVSYTVENRSSNPTPADQWVDVIYLSEDAVVDHGDIELGRFESSGSLPAGETYQQTIRATLSAPVGDYRILVMTDRRGQVTELDRSNNLAVSNTLTLADPLCPSHDPHNSLAVGRTLSPYTESGDNADIVNLSYTVHNLQPCRVEDIQLSTSLATDVTLQDASESPNQDGQALTWELGTLEPYGSVTVDLQVARGQSDPLQLDTGLAATGSIDQAVVTDDLTPSLLRTDPIDPRLLAATVDANSDDRFIQTKAAELNQDADEIFRFVRDEIGFESYVGSLRGSRGTLWSGAGNALDQASLLIALLRASGIPASYSQGILGQAESQELIQSMLPARFRSIGLTPDGSEVSDPLQNAELLDEVRNHYWVQLDAGNGLEDADPTFAGELGDTSASETESFSEVDDALRHSVTVRLERELATPAVGILTGGSPLDLETVLEQTFASAELVGKPLTIGHFVQSDSSVTPVTTTLSNRYSPYLAIGDEGFPIDQSEIIRGTDYQEFITNFPLGSQVLTGLFLETELTGPDGPAETFRRALVDRIRFDIRQHGGSPSLEIGADSPTFVSELDAFTLFAMPAAVNPRQSNSLASQLQSASSRLADADLIGSATTRQLQTIIVQGLTRGIGSVMENVSQVQTAQLADTALVVAYPDRPRLTLVSSQVGEDEHGAASIDFRIDLQRDTLRTVVDPGQNDPFAAQSFRTLRGTFQNVLERDVLALVLGEQANTALSAASVFVAAAEQNIRIVTITSSNIAQLDVLSFSDEAKARIAASVNAGHIVTVPERSPIVDGREAIGWYDIDPEGETIGVNEDGSHGAFAEYAFAVAQAFYLIGEGPAASVMLGLTAAVYLAPIFPLCLPIDNPLTCRAFLQLGKADAIKVLNSELPDSDFGISGLVAERTLREAVKLMAGVDPPVPPLLVDPAPDLPLPRNSAANIVSSAAGADTLRIVPDQTSLSVDPNAGASFSVGIESNDGGAFLLQVETPPNWLATLDEQGNATLNPPPGLQGGTFPIRLAAQSMTSPDVVTHAEVLATISSTSPGIEVSLEQEPLLYVSLEGGQLNTAYRTTIKNLGPTSDTFDVTFANVPAGFEAVASRDSVTIPAGEAALVGVYLTPDGALPAPGTPASFDLQVESQTNSTVVETHNEQLTVPEVHGVAITADDTRWSLLPGTTQQATITFTSVGNIRQDVDVNVASSTGLTVVGLDNLSLEPGEVISQSVTLTTDSSVPLHTLLEAAIDASFGGNESAELRLSVDVTAVGAVAAGSAAEVARRELGDLDLANRLDDLRIALTSKVEDPADEVASSQALAAIESILSIFASDEVLSQFVEPLSGAREQFANASTPQECLDSVVLLGDVLDNFVETVATLADSNVLVLLLPTNSQVAIPQVPREFTVRIENIGRATSTYNLSLSGLPANVDGSLSQTQVTVDSGAFVDLTATVTQTSSEELQAFDFTIDATVEGAVPPVTKSATGSIRTRNEVIAITRVNVSPSFGDAGESFDVNVQLLNSVNRPQTANLFYTVVDNLGVGAFNSGPIPVELTVASSLVTIDGGSIDTTGFADGTYTVDAFLLDENGLQVPGATKSGTLLVGSPVTASIETTPQVLPPGSHTVTTTLTVESTGATGDAANDLTLIGMIPASEFIGSFGTPRSVDGVTANPGTDIVYVHSAQAFGLGTGNIHAVDISEPAAPELVNPLGFGFPSTIGEVADGRLLGAIPNNFFRFTELRHYDIDGVSGGTAELPVHTDFERAPFPAAVDIEVGGDVAFVSGNLFRFNPGSGDITSQHGTVTTFDLSNPQEILYLDSLFDDGPDGGNSLILEAELVDPTTLYVATSTATGGDTQTGVARILVVDVSDPANINSTDPATNNAIVTEIDIPSATVALGLKVIGDRLYVTATGGLSDNTPGNQGFTGDSVLTSIDISDPRNPVVLNSQTLLERDGLGTGIVEINPTTLATFDFSGDDSANNTPQLITIDVSDPDNFVIDQRTDLTSFPKGIDRDGDFIYVTLDDGFYVYEIGGADPFPILAQIDVPNDTGVDMAAESFNIVPTSIIEATDFDTYVFDLAASRSHSITFDSTVTDLTPGESRDATLRTIVGFTAQGTNGQIRLGATDVFAEQIVALTPGEHTIQPGDSAEYVLAVSNPTDADTVFDLAVAGLESTWVEIASSVSVAAGQTVDVPVVITSDPFAVTTEFGFVITASSTISGSVEGRLVLSGEPIVPEAAPVAHGAVLTLDRNQATVGQATSTTFTARLTNTGSSRDTFALSLSDLPAEFQAAFLHNGVSVSELDVPPGANGFREVQISLTPPPGTSAADYPFTVTATSTSNAEVVANESGLLIVSEIGVNVDIAPESAAPLSTFQMTVTNTGVVTETYDLSVAAPAALVATLASDTITLAPSESQTIAIDVGDIDSAFPGAQTLVGIATSQTNAAVISADSAEVSIDGVLGVTAQFDRSSRELSLPGDESFLLMVDNVGNLQDEYTATITTTSGPVTATLVALDGTAARTIPIFLLPGLSTAALVLDTSVTDFGSGEVTVEVRSLTDGSIVASDTATITVDAEFDFGDAPDGIDVDGQQRNYATVLASEGARHRLVVGGPILGAAIDQEPDGQASPLADGDGLDDDGVFQIASLVATSTIETLGSFLVTSSASAKLDAWIDFDANGVLDHPEEHLGGGQSIDLGGGQNVVLASVPAGSKPGSTFARFRLSTTGGLSPGGAANDGEVEDYRIEILDGDAGADAIVHLLAGDVDGARGG